MSALTQLATVKARIGLVLRSSLLLLVSCAGPRDFAPPVTTPPLPPRSAEAFYDPPIRTRFAAATATYFDGSQSGLSDEIGFTNRLPALFRWTHPEALLVTNFSLLLGNLAGRWTLTNHAGPNLSLIVHAPASRSNVVLTLSGTGVLRAAARSSGPFLDVVTDLKTNGGMYSFTNPPGVRFFQSDGTNRLAITARWM